MRNLIIYFCLSPILLLFWACEPTNSNETDGTTKEAAETAMVEVQKKPDVQFTAGKLPPKAVENDTLDIWVKRWTDNACTWLDNHRISGFRMPVVDLDSIVSENAKEAFYYLGIDSSDSLRLIVIGVNANDSLMLDNDKGEFAYDLTHMCPPNCPVISNGNGGGQCGN